MRLLLLECGKQYTSYEADTASQPVPKCFHLRIGQNQNYICKRHRLQWDRCHANKPYHYGKFCQRIEYVPRQLDRGQSKVALRSR